MSKLLIVTNSFLLTVFLLGILSATASNIQMFDGISIHHVVGTDVFFEITDPKELEYSYRVRPARDFGSPFNSSFSLVNAALVIVEPPEACNDPDNHADLEGSVALVKRGECSFVTKAINVEKFGARAVIIMDHEIRHDDSYIEMIDDNSNRECNIPAGFLHGQNGNAIITTLRRLNRNYAIINLPVNMTYLPINRMNQPPWLGW